MKERVVVVGAGISGLTLAWALQKRHGTNITLKIFEKNDRPGGWMRSEMIEGFFFEKGPRSCRTGGSGKETLRLIEALGLQDQVIPAAPAAQQRFVYAGGKLQKVPQGILEFIHSPLMQGVAAALLLEWRQPKCAKEDESILNFITRRLSPEIAAKLVDPLVAGIYAGAIDNLSMRACFPTIWQMEQEHGSLVKGMLKKFLTQGIKNVDSPFVQKMQRTPLFSLREGMETLPKVLSRCLEKELQFGCGVASLQVNKNNLMLHLENGQNFEADRVFLAVPAHAAAHILRSAQPQTANDIDQAKAASVIVVNVGWRRPVLPHEGFGYLIPSRENEDLLGVVWDSSAFPHQNQCKDETRLTAMLGGARKPDLLALSDGELIAKVKEGLHKHLGITAKPEVIAVSRATHAIPQYEVGHIKRVQKIVHALDVWSEGRVQLLGCAWNGVSVNDCIAEAWDKSRM